MLYDRTWPLTNVQGKPAGNSAQMKRRILLFASLLGAVLVIGGVSFLGSVPATPAHWIAPSKTVNHRPPISPAVTQFGYGPLNAASTVSRFDSRSSFRLRVRLLTGVDNTTRLMPLVIDGVLIYGTKDNALVAQDIDEDKVLWKVHLSEGLASAPAVSRSNNRIYFYTTGHGTRDGIVHVLHQINLDGTDLKSWPIDLGSIYAARGLTRPDLWENRIHCKTAVALHESADGNTLFIGCSIATSPDQNLRYGDTRGLTGLILEFKTDRAGNLSTGALSNWFETSRLTGKLWQGFDTGIYDIGSKPAVLPDGSLIVATGNGPVAFEDGNFGCSVISIRPDMKVIRGFSRFGETSQECWSANVEYSNSSVAVTLLGTVPIGGVISKDGIATLFDLNNMDSRKNSVVEIAIGGMSTYGQPAIWKSAADKARFFFQASTGHRSDTERGKDLLVAEENLKQFPNPSTRSCFGYLSRNPASKKLSLLYSGALRDDYRVVANPSETYQQITSAFSEQFGDAGKAWFTRTLWAPYQWISDLGYLFEQPGQSSQKLVFERWAGEEPLGFLKPGKSVENCPDPGDKELQAVYQLTFARQNHPIGYSSVVAIDIDSSLEHSIAWRYPLKDSEHLFNSHPMVSTDPGGRNPVVILPIGTSVEGQPPMAALLFLDGDTGRELYREPFQGAVAYSMPLVFDDYVILSTTDSGLKIFQLQAAEN